MSKISKNTKMLDILSSGRKYSCKQLAEMLEISPRMVRLYKDELEKEGIYIQTLFGKDGGYQLRSQIELPSILFNQYDIEIINNIIKNCSTEEELQNLINLKEKVTHYCKLLNDEKDFLKNDKKDIRHLNLNRIDKIIK